MPLRTLILIVLIVALILSLPQVGLAPVRFGYYGTGGLGLVVIILIILLLLGAI